MGSHFVHSHFILPNNEVKTENQREPRPKEQTKPQAAVAVAQVLERQTNLKGSRSIPSSSSPQVEVSMGKTLNPKIAPLYVIGMSMCVRV